MGNRRLCAVFESPDKTMELMYETVLKLRKVYNFNGYIHLKGIPHSDYTAVIKAARLVDRMSYNVELPSEQSLKLLAPQKTKQTYSFERFSSSPQISDTSKP